MLGAIGPLSGVLVAPYPLAQRLARFEVRYVAGRNGSGLAGLWIVPDAGCSEMQRKAAEPTNAMRPAEASAVVMRASMA